MSISLDIQEIETGEKNGKRSVTFTSVAEVRNSDCIDELLNDSKYDCWCIEGDCGAEFEVTGLMINAYFDEIKEQNPNLEMFVEDNWYRCSVSF